MTQNTLYPSLVSVCMVLPARRGSGRISYRTRSTGSIILVDGSIM
jgi:hypothetical protein